MESKPPMEAGGRGTLLTDKAGIKEGLHVGWFDYTTEKAKHLPVEKYVCTLKNNCANIVKDSCRD